MTDHRRPSFGDDNTIVESSAPQEHRRMSAFKKGIILALAGAAIAGSLSTIAFPQGAVTLVNIILGGGGGVVSSSNPLPISGSFSATLSGFPGTTQTTGTPIAVTTGGVTGTLPAGTVVVAANVGATNNAFCKLGASATTSDQLIAPNSWFGFTVGSNTQLTCITSTSTTTINMVGGAGLPTGAGGGGGGSGGGGAVTLASGAVASGAYSSGSIASGAIASGAVSSGAISAGAYVSGSVLSGAYSSGALVDITNVSTPIAPGTATATKSLAVGGVFNTTQETLTTGQQAGVALSSRGAVFVAPGADNFAVQATLQASSATAIGTVNPTTPATWGLAATTQNVAAPTNGMVVLGQFTTTPTTLTTTNVSPLQMDNAGNLLVNIKAGSSSGTVAQGSTTSGQSGVLTQCAATTAAPTYTTATTNPINCDTAGNVRVNVTTATGLAAGSTTSGQTGSMIMGAVTTAAPTYTTAQTNYMSLTTGGALRVDASAASITLGAGSAAIGSVFGPTAVGSANANPPVVIGGTATGAAGANVQGVSVVATSVAPVTATNTALVVDLRPDSPGIIALGPAADTSAVPVVATPTGNANSGITPVVGGSAISSLVLKASAGNLYAVYANCTAACWLMVFNATAAPANGATTAGVASGNMVECIPIGAGSVGGVNYAPGPPAVYSVGMTAAISSTACSTLTLSTVAMIHGMVK